MKKKRNYMFKFGLSLTLVSILPIEIIVYSIFMPINYVNGNINTTDIFINIGIMFLTVFGIFLLLSFIAFGLIKLYDIDKLEYKDNKISNGFVYIKEVNIKTIRAKRFIFIYSFTIVEKSWLIPSMTYYFYGKEELIDFLNNNSFVLKYVNEKDLLKLRFGSKENMI
ncbi:MAG: hypothetical protein IKP77_07215 [Acholeplasmatales bacterium]|nr:hypothetical protein [Acholeplasmatales bacterium]